ncbi:MAG: rod shape-determining protein MreC [Spirochaetota bacterium]
MDLKGYFQRNRTLVTFALLASFSVLALAGGEASRPREVGMSVLGGIQRVAGGLVNAFSNVSDTFKTQSRLREENAELQRRIAELETQQTSRESLEIELSRLREVIGYSDEIEYSHMSARVIGRDPANVFPTLTINRGRRHGLERNMPVITVQNGDRALVGRLVEVGQGTAKVLPVFHSNAYVAGVHQESRYQGLVAGSGGTGFEVVMRHVSREATDYIDVGDAIVTSGMRSLYPRNIPIGSVTSVDSEQEDMSLELTIEPEADFGRLEHVYVLLTRSN